MEQFLIYIITYLIAMNLYGFILMGWDKSQARKEKRRISERRLFLVAVVGGSPGIWLGMRRYRHKTKHAKFAYGVPALFVAQLLLTAWLIIKQV